MVGGSVDSAVLRGDGQDCSVSLPTLVKSLSKLGVPSEILEAVLANLTPFAVTLPR